MGGKNMKQAEIGIEGAAPHCPRIPGGTARVSSPPSKVLLDSEGRLTPPIGLDALTMVMTFEGYTYEDKLVVSESLARHH